jgi:hypothetical protein
MLGVQFSGIFLAVLTCAVLQRDIWVQVGSHTVVNNMAEKSNASGLIANGMREDFSHLGVVIGRLPLSPNDFLLSQCEASQYLGYG